MHAQRKLADPALTVPVVDAPMDSVVAADLLIQGDLPTSPALLLQAQLAARLAQVEAIAAETHGEIDMSEPKWPMPLRVATIAGLSLLLWGGVGAAAVAAIT